MHMSLFNAHMRTRTHTCSHSPHPHFYFLSFPVYNITLLPSTFYSSPLLLCIILTVFISSDHRGLVCFHRCSHCAGKEQRDILFINKNKASLTPNCWPSCRVGLCVFVRGDMCVCSKYICLRVYAYDCICVCCGLART